MPAEEQRSGGPALWCARRPDRSLEKGVGGFKTGIIRCRAGAGGQRRHRGDGKPVGPDRLLEKEVGRIDIGASEKENGFSFSLSFHYICKLAQMYGASVWSLMMTIRTKTENA